MLCSELQLLESIARNLHVTSAFLYPIYTNRMTLKHSVSLAICILKVRILLLSCSLFTSVYNNYNYAYRDQYKTQYEQQLQSELRHMSASTQDEVEKLRATTRAMYEMESRTLRESRDVALAERDKALSEHSDLQKRYHQLNEQLVTVCST